MRTIITFAALFISVALVQLGSGSLGPLDALSGAQEGFSNNQIGLLGSAHFVGFFIGCIMIPKLMSKIGHSRAFAAVAAAGIISALLHPVVVDPWAWALFRVGTGIAVSGAYTVIESWLNAKVDNANRGRVMGIYRFVDLSGSVGAQLLIAVLEPASYISYNIVAILCCLCLLPLTLTQRQAPSMPDTPRLRPWKVIADSPLGAAGVVVAGLTGSSFRMVGPIFGQEYNLAPYQIGLFLAVALLGGAVAQIPVGWITDRFDRRKVLVGISIAVFAICLAITMGAAAGGAGSLYIASFAFGAAAFPLFSVSSAHANDFAEPGFVVELNASLIMLYAVGAIISPVLATSLIDGFGADALFAYVGGAHVLLVLFGVYRMTRGAVAKRRTPFTYMPRTTLFIARLLRPRDRGRPS